MSLYCPLATYFENKLKIFIELKATKCCCTTLSVDHSQPRNNCSFAHKGSLVPVHSLVCSAHPGVAHCRCAVAVLGMAFGSGNAAVNRINTFASFYLQLSAFRASVVAQLVKNPPACIARDLGSICGLGRSSGEGKDYLLQYSGLENSMDCIVHGVTESDSTEQLSLSLGI